MEKAVTLPVWTCERCGYQWHPRKEKKPKICPKCHSAYWDEVRTRRNKK